MPYLKYYLKKIIMFPDKNECGENVDSEHALYITDNRDIAYTLTSQNCAVLACLNDNNRSEDFGFCSYACENPEFLDIRYFERVYRRIKGIPWDIVETDRCIVRETTVKDVDSFYKIYSEPSVSRYMEPLYEDPNEERAYAQDYIDQVYSYYEFGIWTVTDKVSGEVIGRAGICYREGYSDPELGFVIASERQGNGLATEVCKAILDYAQTEFGFEKVIAFVMNDNLSSVRVCEKLGMHALEQREVGEKKYIMYVWNRPS